MARVIPATLLLAVDDRRLRRDDLRVLVIAHHNLDPFEWRPLKTAVVGRRLHLQRSHAARALGRLVAFGYLDRGPRDDRLLTYRLRTPPSREHTCTTGGTNQAA